MKPLKIVLVMLDPPLPFGSAVGRWYYVLYHQLVARGHAVRAFAACGTPADLEKARREFPADRFNLHLELFATRQGLRAKWQSFRQPFSYAFSESHIVKIHDAIRSGCDLVHCESLLSFWHLLPFAKQTLVVIHNSLTIDLEETQPATIRERLNWYLVRSTEERLTRKCQWISTLTSRVTNFAKHLNPKAAVATVPLGFDQSLYPFEEHGPSLDKKLITIIGNMQWYPTSSAAIRLLEKLWPEIHQAVPDAQVQIVGWSARSVLKDYLHLPNVTIIENVPEIMPYFREASVMLYAPARGSGMKIKVLEAMAFGVPVVTTDEGVEGLPAVHGRDALIGQTDAELIQHTIELLQNPDTQVQLRRGARALVELHCSPITTVDQIEAIYSQMLAPSETTVAN